MSDALLHYFTSPEPVPLSVPRQEPAATSDWRAALPVLVAEGVTLREARIDDAAALLAMLRPEEVARFISPPPTTVDGFERFISWTHRQRAAGISICYVIVPDGVSHPIGLLQVRQLEGGWLNAEWGFAIGSAYWGTGLFPAAAVAAVDFAFETLGVHRLEARAATANGRGNGVLAKLGAVREGTLRRAFHKNGQYLDQALWSIIREDWVQRKAVRSESVH